MTPSFYVGYLLVEKCVVDGVDGLFGIVQMDQNRDLDLTGGDHLDVDIGFAQGFKHLGGNTGVGLHACANYRYLGNIIVANNSLGTQGVL